MWFSVGQLDTAAQGHRPDRAFIEEGEPIPQNEYERFESGVLGEYALAIGDGYYIHGTLYENQLGQSVTHGCIRLGSAARLSGDP